MDVFQFLGFLGLLRTLATGSELGFQWISLNFGDDWGSLERSLPVVTVLRGGRQTVLVRRTQD